MIKTHETERLILRPFLESDFDAVHSYASCYENVKYMPFGPNSEEETRRFISFAISEAEKTPCKNYQFAMALKETGRMIGACNIALEEDDTAEVGWILHRDYWKAGFGTEAGAFLLRMGFSELGLRRIVAHCDSENVGSYRIMERIGMRREGLFIRGRRANKLSGNEYSDELSYAILAEEWRKTQ